MFIESMILLNDRDAGGKRPLSMVVAMAAHTVAIAALIVIPLLQSTSLPPLPKGPLSVVLEAPAPPPPSPPPPKGSAHPPAPERARQSPPPATQALVAPTTIPEKIEVDPDIDIGLEWGPDDGIEGGDQNAVSNGDFIGPGEGGGAGTATPQPIKVGGAIPQPRLIKRVEPRYPAIAIAARVQGTVVLEATTDTNGRVVAVKVTTSIPLLNQAAIDAVEQWVYAPVYLKGRPQPVIFTVRVVFSLR